MRLHSFLLGSLVLSVMTAAAPVTADCGENEVAVQLVNEGDRLRSMDIDGAISKYAEALKVGPSHRIHWKMALAFQKKEAWDKAAESAALALSLAPKHAEYAELRAIALAKQAEKGPLHWSDVKPAFEQALALDPNRADAHRGLAVALLHLHDEKGALVHFTKAVELAPNDVAGYADLADVYLRNNLDEQAERVLTAGEARPGEDSKKLALFTLHGDLLSGRRDHSGSVTFYERAKHACGPCNEAGQQMAYFNLGAAYALASPPRKSEAMQNLQSFQKMICKGAASARFADQCTQAQDLAMKLGGALQ